MNIGTVIKTQRKKQGLKQIELASKCGLSQSYLSSIEKGTKEPTLGVLKDIAKALSLPLPILIFYSLDINDVDEEKRSDFKSLQPYIKGMLDDVFANEQTL